MAVHGKNTWVALDDTTGTLQSLQSYSRNVTDTETTEVSDSSNFGQQDKTYVIGMSDAKITLAGTFAPAFLTQVRGVKAALQSGAMQSATLRFAPAGNAVGNAFTDREVLITQIAVTAQTTDVVLMSVDFQRTGGTTDGTF